MVGRREPLVLIKSGRESTERAQIILALSEVSPKSVKDGVRSGEHPSDMLFLRSPFLVFAPVAAEDVDRMYLIERPQKRHDGPSESSRNDQQDLLVFNVSDEIEALIGIVEEQHHVHELLNLLAQGLVFGMMRGDSGVKPNDNETFWGLQRRGALPVRVNHFVEKKMPPLGFSGAFNFTYLVCQ